MNATVRFYPETVSPFEHEPTRERFSILPTADGRGEAVVSLVAFEPGETVFNFTGAQVSEITLFSLQKHEGVHVHDPFFMGKVLHSCDPNCHVDMDNQRFTAVKPIAPGDCVTMDYNQTEDRLFRGFQCRCGAPNCQGMVRGSKVSADDPYLPIYEEQVERIAARTARATRMLVSGRHR